MSAAFLRGKVWYGRVPHPNGGSIVKRFSRDRKVAIQIEGMCATLKDKSESDILMAMIEGTFTVSEVFAHWPNGLRDLKAKLKDVDLEPYVEKWITTVRAQYPEDESDTAQQYHRQVRDLIVAGQAFPSSRFTVDALEAWVFSRPVSSGTQLRYHAAMSSFCKYLERVRVIESNPMRKVPNPKASEPRVRYISVEEAIRLAEAQAEPYRTLSILSHQGIEYGAAVTITRADVNEARHTIHVKGQKNEWRNRVCYIAPWAWGYVERAIQGKLPSARLVPLSLKTRSYGDIHNAACEAIGLSDYRFHDGRHSYAVRLARAGTPLEVIARQLGHRDLKQVLRCYGRFRPTTDDTARWEKIAAERDAEEKMRRQA